MIVMKMIFFFLSKGDNVRVLISMGDWMQRGQEG